MITDNDIAVAEKLTSNPNDAHGVGFVLPEDTREPYPNGYWKSETVSGRACGYGFYCHKCHLLYVKAAPMTIFHCGKSESFNPEADIQTHRLGSYVRYQTQTEKWHAVKQAVEDEIAAIQIEKENRIDILAPEPTLLERLVTWFRGLAKA
jgi:hypothetical protein